MLAEVPTDRFILDVWKCYLDSYTTYHTFFVNGFPPKAYTGAATMKGSCSAGMVPTNTRGWYEGFRVWLNIKGMKKV